MSVDEERNETKEKNSLVICRLMGFVIPSTPVPNNYHKIISFLFSYIYIITYFLRKIKRDFQDAFFDFLRRSPN